MERNGESVQAVRAGDDVRKQSMDGDFQLSNEGKGEASWTAFVDNLSRRVSRGALWEVFSHYGKVIRVFISMAKKKPRYKETTFAFVRFAKEKDMYRAIEKMNNSKIDGRIISVAKARFPASLTTTVVKKNYKVHSEMKEQVSNYPGGASKLCFGKQDRTDSDGLDSRSYREVLMGKPKSRGEQRQKNDYNTGLEVDNSQKRLLDIHIPAKDIAWIDLSLVAIMKQQYDFEFIQRALLSDGINVKVAKWGNSDLFCVLTFNTVEDKNEAWKEREEGLAFWFDHVEPLLNNKGIPAAFLSISLMGVPLHCWHETFFEALGNRWGSFVSIDINTKNLVDFSVARMIIRAESPHDIPCSLNIRSLGRNYIIKVSIEAVPKECNGTAMDRSATNFADVWPSEFHNIEVRSVNSDSQSLSLPAGKEASPVKEDYPSRVNPLGVGSVLVDNHCTINSPLFPRVSALHGVEDVFKGPAGGAVDEAGEDVGVGAGVPPILEFGVSGWKQSPEDRPDGFGLVISPKQTLDPTSSNSLVGLKNIIVANSSEVCIDQHISPSFEFVPDSFEGLENSFTRKDSSGDCISSHGFPHAIPVNSTPCSLNFTLLNPSHRRAVRRSVREALETPSACNGCSPPPLGSSL
ncbi:hypothetical protein V6N13_067767 [Hibiscus sabdariffa]